ncbi:hypothetical protein [Thalassococcus sp. S3]|uniref:hypothetical protein n=1 Tax=Thalassococcus sp. S3 TaxID=2017482 RepID=UPI0010245285|nr:hypothetical protein [Thalassococcus sp. S3]QBF32141.1 hypothetical protein CFI11_13060 [Thalassococcus sp. S3]
MTPLRFPPSVHVTSGWFDIIGAFTREDTALSGVPGGRGSPLGHVQAELSLLIYGEPAHKAWRAFTAQAPFRTLQVPILTRFGMGRAAGGVAATRTPFVAPLADGQGLYWGDHIANGALVEDAQAQSTRLHVAADLTLQAGTWFEIGFAAYRVTQVQADAGVQHVEFQPRLRRSLPAGEPLYCETPHAYLRGAVPVGTETPDGATRLTITLTEDVRYGFGLG